MKPIKLGVIGLGLIWLRTHKAILATLPEVFAPVAFCDVSEQRRAETAREFPDATLLPDYQSLLKLPEIDAVLVLTPIGLNTTMARAALEAGKMVIMEKPIARSVAEGQQLIALARQTGRRLFVTEQLAYRAADGKRLPSEELPSKSFVETVVRGGRAFGLSAGYLDSVAARLR